MGKRSRSPRAPLFPPGDTQCCNRKIRAGMPPFRYGSDIIGELISLREMKNLFTFKSMGLPLDCKMFALPRRDLHHLFINQHQT